MKKTLLLLIPLLVFSIAFAAIQQPIEKPDAEIDCWGIQTIGFESNTHPGVLDSNKLVAVLSAGESDYYCIKNILGLWDYNFFITITDTTGTQFKTISSTDWNNVEYTGIFGVFPGSQNLVSGVEGANAQNLYVSPTYTPPSGGMTASFIWEPSESILAQNNPDNIQKEINFENINFQNLRTFKRVVVINNGADGYETALLTLGVWY